MNLEHRVLNNMYSQGTIREDNSMAHYTTFDSQYRFEMTREDSQLWFTDTSYKYKCKIDIYNNITGNLSVTLNCTEDDIKNLLDCYTQMGDYCISEITIPPLKPYNSSGNFYLINLELYRIDIIHDLISDLSSRWFNVFEYNPLLNKTVPIISVEMDISELEELMDIMYFIFLIDIDSQNSLMAFGQFPDDFTRYKGEWI